MLKKMGLQARGTAGVDSVSNNGTFDISNADRLGKSETQLVRVYNHFFDKVVVHTAIHRNKLPPPRPQTCSKRSLISIPCIFELSLAGLRDSDFIS